MIRNVYEFPLTDFPEPVIGRTANHNTENNEMCSDRSIRTKFTDCGLIRSSILCVVALLTMNFVQAQTWTGGGDGSSWNDGSNWNTGVVPNSPTAVVHFNPPGSVTDINLQGQEFTVAVLNLASGFVLRNGTLNVSENSPEIAYTGSLNGIAPDLAADLSLVLNLSGSPGTIVNVADGATLHAAGNVSGSGAYLTKAGAGTLRLTGTNTYGGSASITFVDEGTLELGGGSAMASATQVQLRNAAQLRLLENERIQRVRGESTTRIDLGENILTVGRNLAGAGGSFFGAISGSGGLTKVGSDSLSLWGANSYTGTTTVEEGILSLASSSEFADTAPVVVNGGEFLIDRDTTIGSLEGTGGSVALLSGSILTTGSAGDTDFAGQITGKGGLVKRGAGTFTLSGNSDYTQPTTISAGTLKIDGSLDDTSVSVTDDATLAGTGVISGPVTVSDQGIIAPGHSPGTLTTGTLTLNSNSVLNFELADPDFVGGGINDLIEVNGDLSLDGQLNVTGLAGFEPGSYRIFNYSGDLTDNELQIGSLPAEFGASVDNLLAGQVNLEVFALEPTVGLSDTSIDFGMIMAGNDVSATVDVTNTGTDDLVIDELTDPGAPFSITGGSCTFLPLTIPVDEGCDIVVQFGGGSSIVTGTMSSSFDILSNAPSSPDTILVTGTIEPHVIPTLNRYGLLLLVLMIGGLAWRILVVRKTGRIPGI